MSIATLLGRLGIRSSEQLALTLPTLARFGEAALQRAVEAHISITVLRREQSYAEASPHIRELSVRIDEWSTPPAGIFVLRERCIYLRSATPVTIAHEFSHALDCVLGDGIYHSEQSVLLQQAFHSAQSWITPYAATRIDEYFAESLRAYINVNDANCCWPKATRKRLRRIDPEISDYLAALFKADFRP